MNAKASKTETLQLFHVASISVMNITSINDKAKLISKKEEETKQIISLTNSDI